MQNTLVQKEEKNIMQHNAITSGRYDFSACMLDILFMVLSSLKKGQREYTIYVNDIEDITGRSWNYAQLRDATEVLGSRMFEIYTNEKYTQLWLFSKVEYHNGKGSFTIVINDLAVPYFFELKHNFTVLQLKSVLNCPSKYAKRIYALACQWKTQGIKEYLIIDLKNILGLVDKKGNEQYKKISQFKEKVLEVAKQQINQNTNLKIDYKLTKKGRSFQWVTIFINEQPLNQKDLDFHISPKSQKNIAIIMGYGFNYDQASAIEKDSFKSFEKLRDKTLERVKNGKLLPSDFIPYVLSIYQKKGILKKKTNDK